jgi:membrane associated rhomboid family serine protease
MFLPLHDSTPLKVIRFQAVTGFIIAANVAVFLVTHYAVGGSGEVAIAFGLGATPAAITNGAIVEATRHMVPDFATLFTYMFVHASWLHLISNMAFLWVFADNVEDAFGHLGFLALYLVCGVAAGLAHSLGQPASLAPLIGASGAVAGVMAAYLVLFPKARIWVLLFMRIPLRISAAWALIGWFVFQFVSLLVDDGSDQMSIGWWAHIGGFVTGLAITWALRDRLRERLAA